MHLSRHAFPVSLTGSPEPAPLAPLQRLLLIEVEDTGETGAVHLLDPGQIADLTAYIARGGASADWLRDPDRPRGNGWSLPSLNAAFASMRREGLVPAGAIVLPLQLSRRAQSEESR